MMTLSRKSTIILLIISAAAGFQVCIPKDFGQSSIVCVGNSTYYDFAPAISDDKKTDGKSHVYSSTQSGDRMKTASYPFSNEKITDSSVVLKVNQQQKYQTILGFGGAMTDAAGINLASMSEGVQQNILRSYFAPEGIGYSFVRIPIAGSDFSDHYYAYDDDHPGDSELQYFSLTEEDHKYKIPYVKKAQELSSSEIKLFAAAWSAPDWMKNINDDTKASSLKKEYYQTYANYYIKFLQAYEDEGLKFWGLTPQNEPINGKTTGSGWNSMGWSAEQERDYIASNLGPTLKQNGYDYINLMIMDDQRTRLTEWTEKLLGNSTVSQYATGTAIHWYQDSKASADVLTQAHNEFPDKFMLYTESCSYGIPSSALGNWEKGQKYLSSIIEVTNHWVSGWVDWNLVLDLKGGPNWANNNVDAPIIVDSSKDEFYKQPMFYALAHVSMFVPPGSVRIGLSGGTDGLQTVAFLTPDNLIVIILQNTQSSSMKVTINDPSKGNTQFNIAAHSMNSVFYGQ